MHNYRTKAQHALVLIAGILITQFILYGPSLIGRKILLPLDILAQPACYLSPSQSAAWGPPHDPILSDPIFEFETERRFAVSEIRARRFPLWDPHIYCGAPFLAANQTSVLSPFRVLDYLWPGPTAIAWDQVLKALIAGVGAYLFFRRALGVTFIPALIGGWLWPVSGYFIQWAGAPLSSAAAWLPWLFLFTDIALRRPKSPAGVGLAAVTAALLVSGHAETAAQELIANGLFCLWRFFDIYGWKTFRSRAAVGSILAVGGGWMLGILLSSPQSLPTLEYLRTSHRVASRLQGAPGSETPPMGFKALPQLVIPDFNGATRQPAYYTGESGNLPESSSTGYVGLIATLVLAPLSIRSQKYRSLVIFCAVLAILGMAQILNLPLLRQLFDSYPLNLMRENRLVLFTGWVIAIAAVIGLEESLDNRFHWTHGLWIAVLIPIALGILCLLRANSFPAQWQQFTAVTDPAAAEKTLHWFRTVYFTGFALCMIALILWIAISLGLSRRPWFIWTLSLLTVGEAVAMGFNVYPQCDPALYFPRQPMLEYIAGSAPGRVCAVHCLPACLPEAYNLQDVRGYDSIDPARLVDLLHLTQPNLLQNPADEASPLQNYFPRQFPSPLTRMINLRYLIFSGSPPPGRHPRFVTEGYYLFENTKCLPRVFIPRHVEPIPDPDLRLQLLAQPQFDPQEVAYVESPISPFTQPAQGTASITQELPSHITIEFNMQTPGMIFLSDLWDAGWQARVNGAQSPILRANHAFRGVLVPAGKGTLQFDYHPSSFFNGLYIAGGSAIILILWIIFCSRRSAV